MKRTKLPAHKFDGAAIHLYSVSSEKQYIHSSFSRCLRNFRTLWYIDRELIDKFLDVGMRSHTNLANKLLRLLSHYMYFDNFYKYLQCRCLNAMSALIMLGEGKVETVGNWYSYNYKANVVVRDLRTICIKEETNETTGKKDFAVVAAEEVCQAASDVQDGSVDVGESECRPL